MLPRPPTSTLFPYTTLFRSDDNKAKVAIYRGARASLEGRAMFVNTDDKSPAAAFTTIDNPAKNANDIIEKVDRKSTRLNSSHANISYAVFCLKKKKTYQLVH